MNHGDQRDKIKLTEVETRKAKVLAAGQACNSKPTPGLKERTFGSCWLLPGADGDLDFCVRSTPLLATEDLPTLVTAPGPAW